MSASAHQVIRASAGTGKTYQLVGRYLRILFETDRPERIIALTFTRKAAGEFFHKIFLALAEAAGSDAGAAGLSRRLGIAVTREQCHRRLRGLLENLHRLQLSTYDSFFAGIVQTCPYELGLAAPPTLIDEAQREELMRQTQQTIARLARTDPRLLEDFWHAFKQATMGQESKTMSELVADYIRRNHALFQEAPEAELWGRPDRIWPDGCPWVAAGTIDPAAEAAALRRLLPLDGFTPKQREQWNNFLDALADWQPPAPPSEELARKINAKLLAYFDDLPAGRATVTFGKATPIDPAPGAILQRVARFAVWSDLERRLASTRGIHAVLGFFESRYHESVRRMGLLTLEDMTRLLNPDGPAANGLADPAVRAAIDYRLDGRYDHWLLDEFQDTSHAQWRAIANLVDEVVQDAEGERSFFAVGDAKQSIYLWRNSDDRIFERLQSRYQDALPSRDLAESFRSCPAVLAMVNTVFGDDTSMRGLFNAALADRWASIWKEHVPAEKPAALAGHAAILTPRVEKGVGVEDKTAARHRALLDLLLAIRPLDRGLSAAILTRNNAAADAIVDFLRTHGGPECSLAANVTPGGDNVAAVGLLSYLTVAAHPGDSLAWWHLRLTPPGAALAAAFPAPADLSARLLRVREAGGFAAVVRDWIDRIRPYPEPDDAFNHDRLERCLEAALAFDRRGEGDIDAFIRHLETFSLREHDVPGQVAVMTVHKAKGLDWDVVILPDLEGNTILEAPEGLHAPRDAAGDIEWVLKLPPGDVADADPVLCGQVERARNDAGFENLCNLYVGLTRAKRALYVVTHPCGESKSHNLPKLLETTLGDADGSFEIDGTTLPCAWQTGDPEWFKHEPPAPASPAAPVAIALLPDPRRRPGARPTAQLPSAKAAATLSGRVLFSTTPTRADFGTAVHAVFEQIEWLDADPRADSAHLAELLADAAPAIAACVEAALAEPSVRALFVRLDGPADLWREAPFELLHDGRWISGKIDRAVILRDASGRPVSARILDYKTDRLETADDLAAARERHRPQMTSYRRALARLLGLPDTAVSATLIFTSAPTPCAVECG